VGVCPRALDASVLLVDICTDSETTSLCFEINVDSGGIVGDVAGAGAGAVGILFSSVGPILASDLTHFELCSLEDDATYLGARASGFAFFPLRSPPP
jgi:hypothetical protein